MKWEDERRREKEGRRQRKEARRQTGMKFSFGFKQVCAADSQDDSKV